MPNAPDIDGYDHIHVFVADRRAAEAWYRDVLGFERVQELEFWSVGGGPLTLQDRRGSVHIALFERPAQPCRSTLALRVTATQYLRWRTHLNAVLPGQVSAQDHDVSLSLYISDPDGNPYEITTYDVAAVRAVDAGNR